MIHYNYSQAQLEEKAENLLKQFDEERLIKTKPIDVYAVIEKCLDVPYDWKYLTPDQSCLGLTAFNDCYTWVWDEPYFEEGMIAHRLDLKSGTIVIDSTLTEPGKSGRENFTVMHEVFHQVIHKNCFRHGKADYKHFTTAEALKGKRKLVSSIDFIEYQANACAAAFLMPRELTATTFKKLYAHSGILDTKMFGAECIIEQLANEFNVSKQAMKYRLINLNLAK